MISIHSSYTNMDSPKKSNKISDIVKLRQILKKWKKAATTSTTTATSSSSSSGKTSAPIKNSAPIKFIKRTLSFSDMSTVSSNNNIDGAVPKGFLAVCVGEEVKRYVIPMEYLSHQAFKVLLREAEEEFGFQQQGVLKIPCKVSVFEKILKIVQDNRLDDHDDDDCFFHDEILVSSSSHVHPQLCR